MSGITTASAITLGLSAVGTGMGVMGQISQQNAQAQAASAAQAQAVYQAQVARQNEELMRRQAADAIQRGQVAEQNRRSLMQQQIGQQTAALAGQGTDFTGTETDILGDTRAAGELDALTIRANADREAYAYRLQGLGLANEATLQSARAANSTYSPSYLGAGASLLAGASTLSDKWRRFQTDDPSAFVPDSNVSGFTGNGPMGPTGRF
ncbi:hypothetical protein [uncultured Reyranella sp.]|uniref:virion core protein, T7 gp14 family n=1 Tax=uncultured Reyranella sp. TaxID=735512 RepID=UPI00259CF9F5|nr:hypothetical protein [uncultured Reyranella sp.]